MNRGPDSHRKVSIIKESCDCLLYTHTYYLNGSQDEIRKDMSDSNERMIMINIS